MGKNARRKISKNTKFLFLIVFGAIFIVAAYLLIKEIGRDRTKDEIMEKFKYSLKKNITYQVYLKENHIYDEKFLDEDLYYPRKLIDYIKLDLELDYMASEEAPIQLEYEILAIISGFNISQGNKAVYLTKRFPITEKQIINITDRQYNVKEELDIYTDSYIDYINKAGEELGFILDYEILLGIEGHIMMNTPYGMVNIPLDGYIQSYFNNILKFEKSGMSDINDSIKETISIKEPIKLTNIILYSILLLCSFLALIYILLFTRDYELMDQVIFLVKKIQRDYGSRMVAIHNDSIKQCQYIYNVKSIKDLLKVSDEIQKPIFYEVDDDEMVKDFKFYVHNGDELYEYCVLESFIQ